MKQLIYIASLFIFLTTSCKTSLEKVQKSKDFEYKLKIADELYDKKKWTSANTLYEELLTAYKGTKYFESIYYKYTFTFYNDKNYLPASYHFKNFVELFPKSPKADECEYLNALCLYHLSPDYTLDQANTVKAIGEMQSFVNTHPDSKKINEANKMIDLSREKLEEKEKYGAELYYKIAEYRAASVAFEQIIRKFPDSKYAEYYQYMVVKSSYNFAKNSILEKQEERFAKSIADYSDFIRKYPKSQYRSEVERINTLSLQSLKKIARHDTN